MCECGWVTYSLREDKKHARARRGAQASREIPTHVEPRVIEQKERPTPTQHHTRTHTPQAKHVLYKDATIQAQLGQAKQDEIKEVRQQRLLENKMAHSLVFHVVLTINVRPDGEVALNITADKPRPSSRVTRLRS